MEPLIDDELVKHGDEIKAMLGFLPAVEDSDESLSLLERAEQSRAAFKEMLPAADDAPQPTEIVEIAGPGGPVRLHLFRPEGPATAVYLHIHGGGWMLGEPAMNAGENARRAQAGIAVVSVDYRLSPEHPYPAGPDDCQAAAEWVLENGAAEFGASDIVIGGESAGGHLTAVTALRVRDRLDAIERIRGLDLVYGVFDLNGTPSWSDERSDPDLLSGNSLHFMTQCFTPEMDFQQRRHPDVSPLYANWTGMPACRVSVGERDHLRDDSLFLAQRLRAHGVSTELDVYPSAPHGFQMFPTRLSEIFAERSSRWLNEVLGRS